MPTKTTKKTSVKKESSVSKTASSRKVSSSVSSKIEKKDSTKKAVVKRRKLDLTPTRASAVAIASQANREKKQALIDKLASEERVFKKEDSSSKIPLWVRVFFWCALLLFCVSFYQAIIRPQLEEELTQANVEEAYISEEDSVSLWWRETNNSEISYTNEQVMVENRIQTPTTAVETIEAFFSRLSNHEFDAAYDLFAASLQRSSEIREHFTSFRMAPFVSGLQWDLKPSNFRYISTSTYGKDRYGFDLSYTLANNQETYNEEWEFVVDTSWDEPKISRIVCVTSKCSFHPIFWPENFGLMR